MRFVHEPGEDSRAVGEDWLSYKHWDSGTGGYGAMTDFHGYNGNDSRELNQIRDVAIEAKITLSESIKSIAVALRSGFDRFVVRIPLTKGGEITLMRNGQPVTISSRSNPFIEKGLWPRTVLLEAALVDGRFQAAIDGGLLFEPFDYDDPASSGASGVSPVELGVSGGGAEIEGIRIYRDIYYTATLANTPRQSHGMRSGVKLGEDEFFVLGDNSSVSKRFPILERGSGREGVDVRRKAVPGSSSGRARSAQGFRTFGLLGSRSAQNSLHSLEWRERPQPAESSAGKSREIDFGKSERGLWAPW